MLHFESGSTEWKVVIGRKDGIVSWASDTSRLPAPTFAFTQLNNAFSQNGLDRKDPIAYQVQISLHSSHSWLPPPFLFSRPNPWLFVYSRHRLNFEVVFCRKIVADVPLHNHVRSVGVSFDPTPNLFDNRYYKELLGGKSILTCDEALLSGDVARGWVQVFAQLRDAFSKAFANSMLKLSEIAGNGTEIRKDYGMVNS
ncbi:hypothetical protein OSB04_025874 [Centaurea solstitialis]|uniref:peroxidase n=1 Tax=Centaurea solstitialis TaxID=347529 RepID=A0AA38W4D7_9ASTR|nr:hypothetical protein OSB04_025874 [Centaurea solstitialis]